MGFSLDHLVLPTGTSDEAAARPGLGRKPSWLKMKMPGGEQFTKLLKLVNDQRLHTVCQSAKCPNMGECWAAGTATPLILRHARTPPGRSPHIAPPPPPTLTLAPPLPHRHP